MNNGELHKKLSELLAQAVAEPQPLASINRGLWLDHVTPYLRFNDEYYNKFKANSGYLRVTGFTREQVQSAWRGCISVLRQAIITLEIDESKESITLAETTEPLLPPEKVTLAWLWNHTPAGIWGTALALLAGGLTAAFSSGVWVGQSALYSQAMERKSTAVSTPQSTEKTITPANISDSKKIDSPVKSAPSP